jgi:N-acetylglucosamine-6-phosphate deacetylase
VNQQNIILEGIHYASGKAIRLGIRNGMIYSMTDIDQIYRPGEEGRNRLQLVAPGLLDLQVNGHRGVDFNDPGLSPEQVEELSGNLLSLGVTRYYPTLITGSKKRTATLLRTLAAAIGQKGLAAQMIGGIHMEGPFISREEGPRGAHPGRYCLDPDITLVGKWQEQSGGHIRIITMAPELPGSIELIRACTGMGIVVAIGHTSARSDEIRKAVDAGATLSSHLGNGAHGMLPRHPNYIWDQLAEERLYASMIADGIHLPDAVLRVFIRTKREKAILVSDGMPQTGMEPGLYSSPATGKVRLTGEGRLHREGKPDQLAGSAGTLLDGVRKTAALEGLPFAWEMASVHPAKLLNPFTSYGLHVGAPADLVFLDPAPGRIRVARVFKGGMEWGPVAFGKELDMGSIE